MKVRFANNIPTVEEIALLCGGKLFGNGAIKVDSVCTDSREAENGTMFIAIVGERADGHNFIKSVIASGAACALCSRIPEDIGDFPIVLVEDTVKALGRLGHNYSKIRTEVELPDLLEIQTASFQEFIDKGLDELFKDISPITNENGDLNLYFGEHYFEQPKYESD